MTLFKRKDKKKKKSSKRECVCVICTRDTRARGNRG